MSVKKTDYQHYTVKTILEPRQEDSLIGKLVKVRGWTYATRSQGKGDSLGFVSLLDNTTCSHLQIVLNSELAVNKESISSAIKRLKKGAILSVWGKIVESPVKKDQNIEILADYVELYGDVDSMTYPIAKQKMSIESIRQHPHLRLKKLKLC